MASMMDDLELLTEDIPLDYNPESYPDRPAVPAPPVAGNYQIKLSRVGLKKRDGVPVLINGNPLVQIYSFEITEPVDYARHVRDVFQEVWTTTFLRDGKPASGLQDLVRSLDQTRGFSSVKQGIALLHELIAEGREPKVKIDWKATDLDYANAELARLSAAGPIDKATKRAVYKAAEITTMFKFPRKADGTYSNIWTGVDGTKQIPARPHIVNFYASLDFVRLGPSNN